MWGLVFNAIYTSDVDSRRDLYKKVILTGAYTPISGLSEQFNREFAFSRHNLLGLEWKA